LQKNNSFQRRFIAFRISFMERGLFIIFLLFTCFEVHAQGRFEYTHQQMGTQIRLVFYTTSKGMADSVASLAFNRIDELNKKLSDYLDNSELSLLANQVKKEVVVSDDLYRVLKKANEVSEATNGAFDISAGPLIRLWRKTRKTKTLPTASDLVEAKQHVGYTYIKFPKKNVVLLNTNTMQLDLGGIGKGFTADEVIKVLESNGVFSALIDMGGDIRVSNPPPNKENWVLAFSYYNEEGEEVIKKIGLKDAAVATSGDMYQYVEIDGKKYSHIINPQTGMALNNSIQVTTIAKNATLADAYASAYSVIGFDKASANSKDLPNLEIFMVSHSNEEYRYWNSPGFNRYILSE
jgi:thiamine biosynthesis lipoprotein